MYPRDTQYRLATNPGHYRACRLLWDATEPDHPDRKLSAPTVMAIRGNMLIGFLATAYDYGQIIAGPLAVDPDIRCPLITAMRLCEALEEVYRAAGVKAYRFGIRKDTGGWERAIQQAGAAKYAETDDYIWLERRIDGQP